MTLKNEIFEGLGAATAAQKLVYDPRDDYYDAIATAARRENERRKKQQDEYDKGTAAGEARPRGQPAPGAPAGVPTRATSATVPQPTVPGQPPPTQTAMDTNRFPTAGTGYGIPPDLSPSAVELPGDFGSRAARGGKIPGRAIKLRYRAGGPVTPYSDEGPSDEDDDESPEAPDVPRMKPMPHFQPREQGNGGTARHPKMPEDPALIRKPFDADEVWPEGWEGTPEDDPDFDYGTPRHPHAFQRGGAVEDESPADALVKQFLAQSGADILLSRQRDFQMRNTTGVGDRDNRAAPLPPTDEQQRIADESRPNRRAMGAVTSGSLRVPPRPTPPSAEDQDRAGYESGPNSRARLGVLPVAPPPPASAEGSPVIPQPYPERRLTGLDETGVEGSPNIVPPLAAYTPRNVTGQDDIYAPEGVAPPPRKAGADDESRIADEGVPNARARRPSSVPPTGRNEVDETELSGIPRQRAVETGVPVTPSAPGFDDAQPYAPIDPSQTIAGAARKLFPPTSTPAPPSPPLGAGAGMGSGQQAAAAPGTSSPSPHGTTTPPAPPPGGAAANTPSTAPKGEGYQRFQPTERTAMRPDAPDWNPLGMDLHAPKGGTGGGGAAAGPPPRLGMSDPNRVAAFDPTPGGADMTDPTRRRTELSEALIGAATQARRGPNGELPPVGDGAISRSTGQALVQQYNYGGKMEPGEAALAGMMAGYRILLKQNRIPEANQLAYGIMQYANIEAASHAAVAADRVRAGDFLGALQGVAAAATWLPDGMKHEVGADGRSITTKDYSGKVTATTPVDGRWLLAAIEGFTNGDLLWQTLQAAADHLKATDKNAEGRALGHEIQRNTIALQRQRLGKGAAGPKGPAALTEPERKARAIAASVSGVPAPQQPHLPALGGGDENVDPAQQYSTGYDYNEQPTTPQ